MIRHIVFFKFKENISKQSKEKLIADLKNLKGKIPLVIELEVGIDIAFKPNSYDIALNSIFKTFDDLEEYAVHPDHMDVVKIVKELCESSVKVDFEF